MVIQGSTIDPTQTYLDYTTPNGQIYSVRATDGTITTYTIIVESADSDTTFRPPV